MKHVELFENFSMPPKGPFLVRYNNLARSEQEPLGTFNNLEEAKALVLSRSLEDIDNDFDYWIDENTDGEVKGLDDFLMRGEPQENDYERESSYDILVNSKYGMKVIMDQYDDLYEYFKNKS